MNIKEAKEEIKKTVKAYTSKTEAGTYRISIHRQRPVLLIGPPGIGKTAIMEQIAQECSLGLVAYTMTHHTRQSAIGLPVLEKREFQGQEYTITSYTMSEIIASVYEQMKLTGREEGILFLDEINCVSETLMPAMLQFLQYKTFGSHKLPEGWVIVAAGNPFGYNRSVREFDMVTLDRVKRMDVEPDLKVWKSYALERGLHPAVLSFLELKPECFYVIEPGKRGFVTGRGWEDLSEMLLTMEELKLKVEEHLFCQYLQDQETSQEFALYYQLYQKWKGQIYLEEILEGEKEFPELPSLPLDERLCVVWLLLQRLHVMAFSLDEREQIAKSLQYFIEGMGRSGQSCQEQLERRKKGFLVRKDCGLLQPGEEEREKILVTIIHGCMGQERLLGEAGAYQSRLEEEQENLKEKGTELRKALQKGIKFVRQTFGEGQELVIFLTGLLEHPFIRRRMKAQLGAEFKAATEFLSVEGKEEEIRRRLESNPMLNL